MASKALQLRIQEAERSLRALQGQATRLEAQLESLKRSLAREDAASGPSEDSGPAPVLPPREGASPVPPPLPAAPAPRHAPPEPAPWQPQAAAKTTEPAAAPAPAKNPAPQLRPGWQAWPALTDEELAAKASGSPDAAPRPVASKTAVAGEDTEGLELKLGRVWFVRIGIGFLLTGFVFLSTYAYQNFIVHWAPGARVAALYALAALLTAMGFFLERWKDSLRNYGRVVAAGGWAAAYYTTYAAHHVDHLRIIPSATTAAVLLGLCALAFFAYAAWKRSSAMTVAALLMAFYSVAINPMGTLGCFSGLLLSAIGVFFLVRFRWMHTGFAAMAGAYLSYAYWQGLVNVDGAGDTTRWFLIGYWILFTAGVLTHRADPSDTRAASVISGLASLNNLFFFALFNFNFAAISWVPDAWRNALVFGGIILVLSAVVARVPRYPARLWHVLLPQGLALVTWGLSVRLTGHSLFISLTLEALVLAAFWNRTRVPSFRVFAWIAAAIGIVAALIQADPLASAPPSYVFLTEGLLLAGLAHLIRGVPFFAGRGGGLSVESVIASGFALLVPSLGVLARLDPPVAGLWMLGTGLALWAAYLATANRWPLVELTWLSQILAAIGAAVTISGGGSVLQLSLATVLCVALFHLHGHAADHDRGTILRDGSRITEVLFTVLFILSLGILVTTAFENDNIRLLVFASAPLVLHAYGTLAGRPALSGLGQAYYIPVVALSVMGWQTTGANPMPSSPVLLAAIGLVLGHLVVVHAWSALHFRLVLRDALLILLTGLWTGWNFTQVDAWWLVLAWTGVVLGFVPEAFRAGQHSACVRTLLVLGLVGVTFHDASGFALRYLAAAAPLLLHILKSPTNENIQRRSGISVWDGLAIGTIFAITVTASQHTLHVFDGKGLAICWAVLGLAFFALGLATKHRIHRLGGLVLLALALGHVLCVDVWKLGTVMRIVSFLTVGLALLALGFVYNRYHEKLRHLL